MLACYSDKHEQAIPITIVLAEELGVWLDNQSDYIQNVAAAHCLEPKSGSYCLATNDLGHLQQVILIISNWKDFWVLGSLPRKLPSGVYRLSEETPQHWRDLALIAWGLGSYQFTVYKEPLDEEKRPKLRLPEGCDWEEMLRCVRNIYWVRDLINTPAEDLGPEELVVAARHLAQDYAADLTVIPGEDLLAQRYPAIHAVGRASARLPQLIDLRWGAASDPKLTLVGKGVCFDTGGLGLKPLSAMLRMKKDMGGAAHALALARWIMSSNWPVQLRLLIPAVENSVSGWAYRPGDVISTRLGLTVEVLSTDAEGRLVLADALTEAASENPDLVIDFATLTGSREVGLGPDIPAFFTREESLALALKQSAGQQGDPLWHMPLYEPYRELLKSTVADLSNVAAAGTGGDLIFAAVFLSEFINPSTPWIHIDLGAWNAKDRPGRPMGGEAMGLRAVFHFLKNRYCQ